MQKSSSGKEEHEAGGVRQQGTAEDAEKRRRVKHSMRGGSGEAQGYGEIGRAAGRHSRMRS